jgi:hypothetical protein
MGKLLVPLVLGIVLLVYAVFDLRATPAHQVRYAPKALWYLVVLVPFVGPLLWIFLGQRRDNPHPPTPPGRSWGRGPDDDPDFLRNL